MSIDAGWGRALSAALVSGTVASLASSVALALCGRRERGDPAGPLNGPSQWLWGVSASRKRGFSLRHTVAGYLIHHSMSIFWATVFELVAGMRPRQRHETLALAAATSAMACAVDYRLMPERFTPGFERQLSRRSLAVTYGLFALGLAATAVLARRR